MKIKQNVPTSTTASVSGIVKCQILAVNPTNDVYKRVTGKDYKTPLTYEKGALRILIQDETGEFHLQLLERYEADKAVGKADGSMNLYIGIETKSGMSNGKPYEFDVLRTKWASSVEEAESETGVSCWLSVRGEKDLYDVLLSNSYALEKALSANKMYVEKEDGSADYRKYVEYLVETGDWGLYNSFIKPVKELKDKYVKYVMLYTETNGNFKNVRVLPKFLMTHYDLVNTQTNEMKPYKLNQLKQEGERIMKEGTFYSVQMGLVSDTEQVINEIEELPF